VHPQVEKWVEQLSKVPPRQRWGGLAVGICVLAGLHYYLIYMDQDAAITKLTGEYNRLTLERSEKENYARNLTVYESKLNDLQRKLAKAQNLLPDSDDVPMLLSTLAQLGERIGLTIDRFEPQPEQPKAFYAAIPFKTYVNGGYHDIAMFIDAISKMDRIVNVSNISMRDPKVVNKKIVVSGEFVLTTYRFLKKSDSAAKEKGK
jgi:type IV pilus assembly protein PilO